MYFFHRIVIVANQKKNIYIYVNIYTLNGLDFQKLKFYVKFKSIEIFDKNFNLKCHRKLINVNKHIMVILIILDGLKFSFYQQFNNIPFTINYSMQKEIDMIFIYSKKMSI